MPEVRRIQNYRWSACYQAEEGPVFIFSSSINKQIIIYDEDGIILSDFSRFYFLVRLDLFETLGFRLLLTDFFQSIHNNPFVQLWFYDSWKIHLKLDSAFLGPLLWLHQSQSLSKILTKNKMVTSFTIVIKQLKFVIKLLPSFLLVSSPFIFRSFPSFRSIGIESSKMT